jgi:hypothetical protein
MFADAVANGSVCDSRHDEPETPSEMDDGLSSKCNDLGFSSINGLF